MRIRVANVEGDFCMDIIGIMLSFWVRAACHGIIAVVHLIIIAVVHLIIRSLNHPLAQLSVYSII